MTKKQIRKYAKEFAALEKIHRNKESSQAEVALAEKRIIQLTNLISCLPDGLQILDELDIIIQKELEKET